MKIKKLKLCLTLSLLVTLSGCSTSPFRPANAPLVEKEVIFISLPTALTQHFCEFQGAGDSVATLAEGFVYNTVCGKKYKAQLEEQNEYIKNVKEGKKEGGL